MKEDLSEARFLSTDFDTLLEAKATLQATYAMGQKDTAIFVQRSTAKLLDGNIDYRLSFEDTGVASATSVLSKFHVSSDSVS